MHQGNPLTDLVRASRGATPGASAGLRLGVDADGAGVAWLKYDRLCNFTPADANDLNEAIIRELDPIRDDQHRLRNFFHASKLPCRGITYLTDSRAPPPRVSRPPCSCTASPHLSLAPAHELGSSFATPTPSSYICPVGLRGSPCSALPQPAAPSPRPFLSPAHDVHHRQIALTQYNPWSADLAYSDRLASSAAVPAVFVQRTHALRGVAFFGGFSQPPHLAPRPFPLRGH